jgi:competence ComEA-like helix-hairpin-helix protein
MAELVGAPTIERLQDILDIGNTSWAGVEINFHVKPASGEKWGPDFAAGCLLDGEPAVVPEAINQQRQWDKDPQNTFYCYAPIGYVRDGARMTLRVHPRDKKGRPTEEVVWQDDFRVWLKDDRYFVQRLVSLSTGAQEELDALPGVGPVIAAAIIAHRHIHGPFATVDQLDEVPMVGPAKIEGLRALVKP